MSARAVVLYSGLVQGVGFRWRTAMTAEPFPVLGYVRNLSDGRVEVVAEGERDDVDAFLAALRERMAGHIAEETIEWLDGTNEFEDFGIRR